MLRGHKPVCRKNVHRHGAESVLRPGGLGGEIATHSTRPARLDVGSDGSKRIRGAMQKIAGTEALDMGQTEYCASLKDRPWGTLFAMYGSIPVHNEFGRRRRSGIQGG